MMMMMMMAVDGGGAAARKVRQRGGRRRLVTRRTIGRQPAQLRRKIAFVSTSSYKGVGLGWGLEGVGGGWRVEVGVGVWGWVSVGMARAQQFKNRVGNDNFSRTLIYVALVVAVRPNLVRS